MAEGGIALKKEDAYLEDDAKFPCLICGEKGLTQNEMRVHIMMAHVERDISCPFCDLSGITSNEMNLHINSVHLAEENTTAQSSKSSTLSDSLESEVPLSQTSTAAETHSKHQGKVEAASDNAQTVNSQNGKPKGGDLNEVSHDKASLQTQDMAGGSGGSHEKSCNLHSKDESSQTSSNGEHGAKSSETLDKTRLFLDVNQPKEEVGVLRMTQGFNNSHDNTSREAAIG